MQYFQAHGLEWGVEVSDWSQGGEYAAECAVIAIRALEPRAARAMHAQDLEDQNERKAWPMQEVEQSAFAAAIADWRCVPQSGHGIAICALPRS